MSQVTETIEVDVPVNVAYNQWTQFEEFPNFMDGVDEVRQLDDTHLHWVASFAGVRREWDAKIDEQVPDKRVSWSNVDGATNKGTVRFDRVAATATRVTLELEFEPDGLLENVGDKLGFVSGMARRDLELFRDFITNRGASTGAWRGEVHHGRTDGRRDYGSDTDLPDPGSSDPITGMGGKRDPESRFGSPPYGGTII